MLVLLLIRRMPAFDVADIMSSWNRQATKMDGPNTLRVLQACVCVIVCV